MKILSIVNIQSGTKRRVLYSLPGTEILVKMFPGNASDRKIESELRKEEEKQLSKIQTSTRQGQRLPLKLNFNYSGSVTDIAVCVTCHEKYLKYLQRQIIAIDNQSVKPAEKFLALDGCKKPDFVPLDWTVINYSAQSPNPGRNLATEATKCEWIVFADADDEMHPDYIKGMGCVLKVAPHDAAIIFANFDADGKPIHFLDTFDYWALRQRNYISACSGWRVNAVKEAGGWPNTGCYDDYSLAVAITRMGYAAEKNPVPIKIHLHGADHRHLQADAGLDMGHKWDCRTFGIVSLLAGRKDCLQDWQDWIKKADLPPMTTLYVLDNSGNAAFGRDVKKFLSELDISFYYQAFGKPCDANRSITARHEFVPYLYNQILPHVNTDWLVLLEDDVTPPLNGLKKLVEAFSIKNKCGAISGAYPSRTGKGRIVAAKLGPDYWKEFFYESEVNEDKIYQAGFIAGGFALWNMGQVKKCLPFRFRKKQIEGRIAPYGWDTNLSNDVKKMGFNLFIHGGVKCGHKVGAK